MNRRRFLKRVALISLPAAAGGGVWLASTRGVPKQLAAGCCEGLRREAPGRDDPATEAPLPGVDPTTDEGARERPSHASQLLADQKQRSVEKSLDFDNQFQDDVRIEPERRELLVSASRRLERAQKVVGHGHFNLLGFDELLLYARRYSSIGAFPEAELRLMDDLFHADATRYGFLGDKVIPRITDEISKRDTFKIGGSGHYLIKGEPLDKYRRLRRDLGPNVVLTSGVRSVVKQFQLFLRQSIESEGNLSRAARSLAPPGYSYHAVGDFDIGRVGLGEKNFTEAFAETPEYAKLIELGYVEIRYPMANDFGVRHEPWHIKIG